MKITQEYIEQFLHYFYSIEDFSKLHQTCIFETPNVYAGKGSTAELMT